MGILVEEQVWDRSPRLEAADIPERARRVTRALLCGAQVI
jgi:hypothetical protein